MRPVGIVAAVSGTDRVSTRIPIPISSLSIKISIPITSGDSMSIGTISKYTITLPVTVVPSPVSKGTFQIDIRQKVTEELFEVVLNLLLIVVVALWKRHVVYAIFRDIPDGIEVSQERIENFIAVVHANKYTKNINACL